VKAKVLVILTVLLFLVLLILFTTGNTHKKLAVQSPSDEKSGGTLVVGISGDIDSFNPLFNESAMAREITHLALLGLADLNENMEFKPELATSWKHSEDRLHLTYHLRKDAKWSDGVLVSAEDVKFTYDLLQDTLVASPNQSVAEFIEEVIVKDSFTVVFKFTQAYPNQIFDTAGEILPKHILQDAERKTLRNHPFGREPVSNGPFILSKWISQQYIELVPNQAYFGNKPLLERVVFKVVSNNTNLLNQLKTNEIDMVIGVPPEEVSQIKDSNSNINIYPVSGRLYHYVGYNKKNPLFASAQIRQALTMGINRQEIIEALLYGFGRVCIGHLPPMLTWAYNNNVKPLPYSISRAKRVLSDEGWSDSDDDGLLDINGKKFEFDLKINTGNKLKTDVAVVIQNQLQQMGVKMNIKSMEWSAYLRDLREGNFDAHLGAWSTSLYIDPTPIFHTSATNLFNWVHYSNSKVDRLIEIGREEMDLVEAAAIWKELQEVIYKDQPYTFLYWIDRIIAVNAKFKNVHPIPLSALYNLEEWYIESESKPLSLN
jgi:peptide/nickel transport system substrate-binding protein